MSRATASATRHKMGFLPGTDAQKMAPWLIPIMSALQESARAGELEKFKNEKRIETLPFEHMQGRTVKDGVFLLDEAQNCTLSDLEMFITRIGEGAQIIICGDQDQVVPGIESGLMQIVEMIEAFGLNAGVVIFDENDVVRSETAAEWVKAFKLRRQSHGISFLQNAA
jgi:phosphate starvation-inducible PhoH-like protein